MAKQAGDSPGHPRTRNYGDFSQLQVGQLLDLIVQEHNAARAGLHYDVRLGSPELGLYSWAVRKGVPGPGQRFQAIQQPVHRHSYKDFEGTIPAGRYGAGTVKKHLAGRVRLTRVGPGEVHFEHLDGQTVRPYVLVQPRKGPSRNWLLINPQAATPPANEARYAPTLDHDGRDGTAPAGDAGAAGGRPGGAGGGADGLPAAHLGGDGRRGHGGAAGPDAGGPPAPRKAVLITGNPKYIANNPQADAFHTAIEKHLQAQGYAVSRDPGADGDLLGVPKAATANGEDWTLLDGLN